ncbi:hypothetical protein N9L48_05965 [Psychrosphaera sp.]|nr:hypothetical protein [Psychrosphaera sp.]
MKKTLTLMTLLLLNSGCASHKNKEATGFFLRSEFSWWEAKRVYEFKATSENRAEILVELQNDGNPYHLKVADKAWSSGKNCGVYNGKSNSIKLDEAIQLSCPILNKEDMLMPLAGAIKFTPPLNTKYKFIIYMQDNKPVSLSIKLANTQ